MTQRAAVALYPVSCHCTQVTSWVQCEFPTYTWESDTTRPPVAWAACETISEDLSIGDRLAVMSRPEGDGPWPGVVMLHEAWGVDDVLRRQAERMASAGYLVLAPDLLGEGLWLRCIVRDHAGVLGAQRAAVRADRGGPPGAAGRSAVHRSGRGDRLLHGRRVRVAGRRRTASTWPRSTTARCPRTRPRCCAVPARSWPATAAGTAGASRTCPGCGPRWPSGRSRPTSRCIPRPGTASSITPPTDRSCSAR